MRNPDPSPRRFTSLAWAAVLGHEETFEFLLSAGHDDEELSKVRKFWSPIGIICSNPIPVQDSENNNILMLLADQKPSPVDPYAPQSSTPEDISGASLRMARLYYDRYSEILDWSNTQGKTALHIASLKGNEELVRVSTELMLATEIRCLPRAHLDVL